MRGFKRQSPRGGGGSGGSSGSSSREDSVSAAAAVVQVQQRRHQQGKVTVKYDRKELRKRLVLEEWIVEQLGQLYGCEDAYHEDMCPALRIALKSFQPLFHKLVPLPGTVVTQVQDPVLGLAEPQPNNPACLDPSAEPSTLQQINIPSQLNVICKLTEGVPNPLIQIISKDIKQG
ncbi:hypothetical protein TURU_085486 [Turdus rufiventris]|nr:hypothetical protein TURU_085486 [Turdus rufiventris]